MEYKGKFDPKKFGDEKTTVVGGGGLGVGGRWVGGLKSQTMYCVDCGQGMYKCFFPGLVFPVEMKKI